MRSVALGLTFFLSASGILAAQELSLPAANSQMHDVYVVQLTEYQMDEPVDPARSAAEIVKALTSQGEDRHEPIETLRFSTLSGTESLIQFGKRISVSVGSVTVRGGTTQQTEFMQIGTIVRATVTPQAGKVALQLQYETSRLAGETAAGSPPSVSTTEISSTQLLEIGRPTLVAGSSADASTFLLVTIAR